MIKQTVPWYKNELNIENVLPVPQWWDGLERFFFFFALSTYSLNLRLCTKKIACLHTKVLAEWCVSCAQPKSAHPCCDSLQPLAVLGETKPKYVLLKYFHNVGNKCNPTSFRFLFHYSEGPKWIIQLWKQNFSI